MKHTTPVILVSLFLVACQPPDANLQSNVYKANQVNSAQSAMVVTILAVTPAKVEADNSQQKRGAEVIGGVLGAIGGGMVGNKLSNHNPTNGTVAGAAAGGIGGAAVGSLVPDTVLVDGISIAYKYQGHVFNSAQVGRPCEYEPGKAIVVSTSPTETRVQPNATCPEPARQGE